MATIFPGSQIEDSTTVSTNQDNPTVKNVLALFKALPRKAQYFNFQAGELFNNTDDYEGLDSGRTHFQGVVRHSQGSHFIISGGIKDSDNAQLFVLRYQSFAENVPSALSSKIRKGPCGSNIIEEPFPIIDSLIEIKRNIQSNSWHGGGISLSGDILAFPIENPDNNSSIIIFLDCTLDPSGEVIPKRIKLTNEIIRPNTKAGAVAFTRLPNDHFICGVWSDSDGSQNKRFLDFYYSKSTHLKDGFGLKNRWDYDLINRKHQPKFQAAQFAVEENTNKIFLIGTENKSFAAPFIPGKNRAFIYSIDFPAQDITNANFQLVDPNISLLEDPIIFAQAANQYNFDGAAGIYFTPDQGLALYSAFHWKHDRKFKLGEFYPARILVKNPQTVHDGFVALYENKNFGGRHLIIYGRRTASTITNYSKIKVQNKSFDNKVESIIYNLAPGVKYELYENDLFNTLNAGIHLTLLGTGQTKTITDLSVTGIPGMNQLNANFSKKISSSRFVG